MSRIEAAFSDLGRLDRLAEGETFVHRLDPLAKVLTTIVYVVCIVSYGKYELSALAPFALYPVWLAAAGGVPPGFIARKVLAVSPFALLVGIWNPLFDQKILLQLGSVGVSGGWVSFFSIMARFVLTVGCAFVLIGVTSFNGLCLGLQRLGTPRVMTVQLLFLYRYLFVLGEEVMRISRARALRSFGGRGMGLKVFSHIVGSLLLRTLDRAERVYQAMLARGFDGEIRLARPVRFGLPEAAFTLGWSAVFILLRLTDVTAYLGRVLAGN